MVGWDRQQLRPYCLKKGKRKSARIHSAACTCSYSPREHASSAPQSMSQHVSCCDRAQQAAHCLPAASKHSSGLLSTFAVCYNKKSTDSSKCRMHDVHLAAQSCPRPYLWPYWVDFYIFWTVAQIILRASQCNITHPISPPFSHSKILKTALKDGPNARHDPPDMSGPSNTPLRGVAVTNRSPESQPLTLTFAIYYDSM